MESRRSFLAAALAWLASLAALAWPRRALSSPRRGFTPPTAPAEPDVRRFSPYREPEPFAESVRVYEDLHRMLDEMHDHLCLTGHSVLSADDPEARRIGFFTFSPERDSSDEKITWQIPLTRIVAGVFDVPRSFATPGDPEALRIFREHVRDAKGRVRLAKAYEAGGRTRFERGLGPLPR
jgi:hypothetical protein